MKARDSRVAAAVDIGTNTVLLTIATGEEPGDPRALLERATITRLGAGVDRSGELDPDAVGRTLAALGEFASRCKEQGVSTLEVVGTSALRDAVGGEDFVRRAAELLGVMPRVISGKEEARLTRAGAAIGLDLPETARVTVFDVGGGSTEIISDVEGGQRSVSLDVGCVRMTERSIRTDPPNGDECHAIASATRAALATTEPPEPGGVLVGVAGTVTTLSAMSQELSVYQPERVHGSRLTLKSVEQLQTKLAALTQREREALPGLEPKRADVIVAGATIVLEVLRWSRAHEILVSDRGVRWGLLAEVFSSRQ